MIPRFQRDYSWEKKNCEEFLDDIIKCLSKQSLRAVLRTLIKIYTFAPNFKFGTK